MLNSLRWLGFPAIVCGAMGVTAWGLAAGRDPDTLVMAVAGTVTLLMIVLERVIPVYAAWNRRRGDLVADGLHSIVSIIVIPELLRVACFGALASFALWAEGRLGIGLWPHGWPLAAQVALALVFIEFAQYWVHRAQHHWPLLWRFHAVHHSAPRLYWLNAGRVHPLEAVANYLVAVPILVALGCGADALTLYLVLITTSGSVQHANVDFRLGPLNWIFSQGENHRWHHAPQKRVADHNFGVVLIIWDVVFGTRKAPGAWPEEVGVEPVGAYPKGYLAHLWAPFRSSTRSIDSPPSIG